MGGEFTAFFLSVPEWWPTTVEFATVDDHGDSVSRSLDTILESYVYVIASVVSRNEVLCVRILLAKVYFDIYTRLVHTAQLSTVLKYSDTYHLCTLNVIFQIAFC